MSLAILVQAVAMTLSTPDSSTIVSCAASSANLFGAEVNGSWVRLRDFLREILGEALGRVEAGADRGAALREPQHARQHAFDPLDAVVDLRRIAGEFLAERQRRRVLQVGAADLDDRVPALRLVGEARVHRLERREQLSCAPRAPAAMCIAVGKLSFDDWLLLTWSLGWTGSLPPRLPVRISLARPAITSLAFMFDWVPDPVCQMTSGNWLSRSPRATSRGRLLDDLGELGVEAADPRIHPRRGLLDEAQRMDDLERHLLARTEREILDRPLGLRAPISVGGDFDRPEAVGLGAGVVLGIVVLRSSFPRKRESTFSWRDALEGRWTPDQVRGDELRLSLLPREVHADDVRSVVLAPRPRLASGASFSASSCSSRGTSSALAWKVSANSTAGSWNWVTAANGTWSVDGTPPNDRPTVKLSSSTFKSQKRCWMTIVISSGKRSSRCLGIETPGIRVLKVM